MSSQYRDDKNRVIVHDKKGQELYVNASSIKDMDDNTDAYIALGGPRKEEGYKRLWKLLLENGCKTVVMLNTREEEEKERYWPKTIGKSIWSDTITVAYSSGNFIDKNNFIRLLNTRKGSQVQLVKQLQYTDWPEKGVPNNVQSLVAFLDAVKLVHRQGSGPLVVHGRCGAGRTGIFIVLNMLSKEVEDILNSDEKEIGIYSCVEMLPKQRICMIEN